jgi:hypothetical protein
VAGFIDELDLEQYRIRTLIDRSITTLDSVDLGVWTSTFAGSGGTPYLMKTVADLLLDPRTTNRPPFDDGDEALSALFFVAGAEDKATIDAFVAILATFLGEPGDGFNVLADITRTEPTARPPTGGGPDGTSPPTSGSGASDGSPSAVRDLGLGHNPEDGEC